MSAAFQAKRRILRAPGAVFERLRTEYRYSFTSQSIASSRVAKIGRSRCEKLLKFS